MVMRENPHFGKTLNEFLEEEGMLEHTQAVALKRMIAYRINDLLKQANVSQAELARRMGTSKAAINRLLNPNNTSLSINTLIKVTQALGKKISVAID